MFQFMLDLFDDFSRFSIQFDECTDFFMYMDDGRVIAPAEPAVTAAGRAAFADWAALFAEALIARHVPPGRAADLGRLAVTLLEGCLVQARVDADGSAIRLAVAETARLFEAAMGKPRQ